MNVTGIIAEYNSFHNGHAFHIEETRKNMQADYCIAVISGDFVQRGAPALLNKYDRTKMALENGIDLVIELPVIAATSSAENFAQGGVCLLDALGVVSNISFGAEANTASDIDLLGKLADFFAFEPPAFQEHLDQALKSGYSFPTARARAALTCLQQIHSDSMDANTLAQFEQLLASPNNILAIEYMKAIRRHNCKLTPSVVTRTGAGYHDTDTDTKFASASALRKFILQNNSDQEITSEMLNQMLTRTVPDSVRELLLTAYENHAFLQEDDFSDLLYYELQRQLLHPTASDFDATRSDLAQRIENKLESFTCWSEFVSDLKTKNQTYTAISRYLLHALLGIDGELLTAAKTYHYAPYARILGFRKDASPLLKELQAHSQIPLLRKIAKERLELAPDQQKLLDLDVYAANLYNRILFSKSGIQRKNEYREPLIIL
ncbi:nucleotidyltransferase family protein [Eubacterium sp.]|uniref:tRNA(Met) cytidine acetate ligase n=1 Tax=Eubacterium sp. TaxID=142586 RepID=UPI003AB537A9